MGIYGEFAGMYDKLMTNVPPKKQSDYIELLWSSHGIKPRLVLDLACGTGGVAVNLSKRGYDMIGVDMSCEMLTAAQRKSKRYKQDVLFLNQDMRQLELYGSVDAVICLCDSINYILEQDELFNVFCKVYYYLNPGGVFIFDVNTEYKFAHVLKNNTFAAVNRDTAYIWENSYDKQRCINEYYVTFFAKKRGTEMYERFEECHYERAYSTTELESALLNAGFNLLGMYDAFALSSPKSNTERIFFVSQK